MNAGVLPPVRNGQEYAVCGRANRQAPHFRKPLHWVRHLRQQVPMTLSSLKTSPVNSKQTRFTAIPNGFRLFLRLPPSKGECGRYSRSKRHGEISRGALSGRMTPNLGDWLDQEPDWESVIGALPKKANFVIFSSRIQKGSIRVALKPQTWINSQAHQGTVRELLGKVDERGYRSSKPPVQIGH